MENIFSTFKSLAEKTRKTILDYFKETTTPNLTTMDLIELVKNHPKTKKETKFLLGNYFHFYTVRSGELLFRLESREKTEERILEFRISDKNGTLFSYKCYLNSFDLSKKIELDQQCFFSLLES